MRFRDVLHEGRDECVFIYGLFNDDVGNSE
jgi:hypothetical protein